MGRGRGEGSSLWSYPGATLGKGGDGLLGLHVGESLSTLKMHPHLEAVGSQPPGMGQSPSCFPFLCPVRAELDEFGLQPRDLETSFPALLKAAG